MTPGNESLLTFMQMPSDLDALVARSIPGAINAGEPLRWIPSHSSAAREPHALSRLDLLLVSENLLPLAMARIRLGGGPNRTNVDISVIGSVDDLSLEESVISLLEWMRIHLDLNGIEPQVEILDEDGQEIEWSCRDTTTTEEDKVLTAGPIIGPREVAYVLDAVRNGWNSRHSDYIHRFENAFADFTGVDHAIATSSCTGALHLALLAMGIQPGDEVIVPETTWVATAAAVRYLGATPVFVDVDEDTWTMDPDALASRITDRSRAVIPVHLYGVPADMDRIVNVARENSLMILEDAAPAIGATIKGRAVGSFGDMAAFSFQGAKLLVTGEGGMLVTSNADLRERAWKQQDHGRVPGTFWIDELGRKYKMSNLNAALGLAQLEGIDNQIAKKRQINSWYRELLHDVPGLRFQNERHGDKAIFWMTSVSIKGPKANRERVVAHLRSQGIDTRPVFPAISSYPIWGDTGRSPGLVASRLAASSINLPSGAALSRRVVERVVTEIRNALAHD